MKHLYRQFGRHYGNLIFLKYGPEAGESSEGEQNRTETEIIRVTKSELKALQKSAKDGDDEAINKLQAIRKQRIEKGRVRIREKANEGGKLSTDDEATKKLLDGTAAKTEVQATPGATTPTTPEEPNADAEQKDISLTTILPYEESSVVGANEESPTATPTDRSTPLVEMPAPVETTPPATREVMPEGGVVPVVMPETSVDRANRAIESAKALSERVAKLRDNTEAVRGVVDNNAKELAELKEPLVIPDSSTEVTNTIPKAKPTDVPASVPSTPDMNSEEERKLTPAERREERIGKRTELLNKAEVEKMLAERKQAEADKAKAELEKAEYDKKMADSKANYEKTISELNSKKAVMEAEKVKAPNQDQPTSSPAPASFEGPIDNRPDVVVARQAQEAAKKEADEAAAKEAAKKAKEEAESPAGRLLDAVINRKGDAIKLIENEFDKMENSVAEKTTAILRLSMTNDLAVDKERLQILVDLSDKRIGGGSFRKIAKNRLRLLTKGGPAPQENLPERVYQHTDALKKAFANNNGSEINKIEAKMNYHLGLRGGGKISKSAEIIDRKQKVVNELSREELQYIVKNTKESKDQSSLHSVAKQRLDTMPKEAE